MHDPHTTRVRDLDAPSITAAAITGAGGNDTVPSLE